MRQALFVTLGLLLGMVRLGISQDVPSPDTRISNVAGLNYRQQADSTLSVQSNSATTIINVYERFAITPADPREVVSGGVFEIPHQITNTGNITTTIALTVSNTTGDQYDFSGITLSGIPTKGKAKTASTQQTGLSVTLSPGETTTVTYRARVSPEEETDVLGKLLIRGVGQIQGYEARQVDRIRAIAGPLVSIHKEISGGKAIQGGTLRYRLTGRNSGSAPANPTKITVDGQPRKYVLIRDAIPRNTNFVAFLPLDAGTPLYHLSGEPQDRYHSAPPENLARIDEIAVGLNRLPRGQTFDINFDIVINENAAGTLTNVAEVLYTRPFDPSGETFIKRSNPVTSELPAYQGQLHFYSDSTYTVLIKVEAIGSDIHLQADDAQSNRNRSQIDTTQIALEVPDTGDREIFTGVETGINSGFFRLPAPVPSRDATQHEVDEGNRTVEAIRNGSVTARMAEGGNSNQMLQDSVAVSPYGVVFDTQTNEPVANVTVTLIDVTGKGNGGQPGAPADVFNATGQQQIDNPQTTSANGEISFPYLKPSTYRLQVETPEGYSFASEVPPGQLPENRQIDPDISYGKAFTIGGAAGSFSTDIPVDPQTTGMLFIDKKAAREEAEVGGFLRYEVDITNNADSVITQIRLVDQLPLGFKYEEGTARLEGQAIEDPAGGRGPKLTFDIGAIEGQETVTLSYWTLAGPASMDGDGINTAQAFSDEPLPKKSNKSRAKVEVNGGVFTDKGYIVGRVFMDCNENGMQDPGEPGVPGVQLFLENGTFVVTDSEGLYSFYGVKPNMHILKLDNYSLPEGATLKVLDNRNALDPSSRFVDLKNGQMHRADFALCNCSEQVKKQIVKRKKALMNRDSELEEGVSEELTRDGRSRSNIRREQASGILGSRNSRQIQEADSLTIDSLGVARAPSSDITAALTEQPQRQPSDSAASGAAALLADIQNNDLGFLGIADGDTVKTTRVRLQVKSPAGARIDFRVNGKPISDNRISRRTMLKPRKAQLIEYIGVALKPGRNILHIAETDPFGNLRAEKSIQIYASGEVANFELNIIKDQIPADGQSTAVIQLRLLDNKGLPVKTDMPVTLDVSAGRWKADDQNPGMPGTQTFIRDGKTEFRLLAPRQPGVSTIRASVGRLEQLGKIHFLPDFRPLLAAGIIEGTIRLSGSASIFPTGPADGFERELKALAYSQGNWRADGRAAFYLKGKVKGDVLLTASYDSEKNEEAFFRSIQPDQFYPVYGDASVRGFDAQSTGRLYVRVQKDQTYALMGDFVTQRRDPARNLGKYNRTVNGLKAHYETDWAKLNLFGTQTTLLQRIEEFRAQGISGPYALNSTDIRLNSEQVEIITRDRNQPSVIIDRKVLTRFRDYTIEPFSGNLMFKEPIASMDENMNPRYIRVIYEVESGGTNYLLAGGDASIALGQHLKIGGSFVEDRNPENRFRLMSANATLNLSKDTRLIAEAARTETALAGTGQGARVELLHKGKAANVRAFAGKTDKNFSNRAAMFGQGRTEAGLRGELNLTASTKLQGEFLYTSNDTAGTSTTGGLLGIQQRITENIRVEAGARYVRQEVNELSGQSGDQQSTNLRGKITSVIPGIDQASVFGEYEQDIHEPDQKVIAVGGDYRIPNHGRIYARHEFISSALGRYALNSSQQRNRTIVGLDAEYMENGSVYSEYRVNDASDGRSAQAAIGVRNRFHIREGFGINAGIERIFSLEGGSANEGTAISTSLDYTANPLWKGTARAETRFSPNGDLYVGTLGYGQKISPDWTFLGKNIFALQTSATGGTRDRIQQRLRLGMAYRQTETNRWNALGRYELKYEEYGEHQSDYRRLVHLFSTHANYHPAPDWTFSARYAAKYLARKAADELDAQSITQMLSARGLYDITRRLDVSLMGSVMGNEDLSSTDYGLGGEIGVTAMRNLRVAIGANLFGFNDRDLTESTHTRKGLYLGFSYKFDEQLFRGLMPKGQLRDPGRYLSCGACVTSGKALRLPDNFAPVSWSKPVQPVPLTATTFPYIDALALLPNEMHFATDKAIISPESAYMLDIFSFFLRRHDEYQLLIKGHTDHDYTYDYNLALSKRRAKAIRAYLIASGVDPANVAYKGLSYTQPEVAEKDVLDKALNRRVDFSLDVPNVDIYFLSQLEDLKVDPEPRPWDYVFDFRHNAVPDRIHFIKRTAQLNFISRYLLKRIQLVLQSHPKVRVLFTIHAPDPSLKQLRIHMLREALSDMGMDNDRFRIETNLTDGSLSNRMAITYRPSDELVLVGQNDDLKLADHPRYRSLIQKAERLLIRRKDAPLINEIPGLYYLPERLIVDNHNEELSVETAAVLSRIGSYMRNNPSSVIRVEANSSPQNHLPLVREFLIDWGIDGQRIRINDTVNRDIPANEILFYNTQ